MTHAPALPLQQSPGFGAALGLLGRRVARYDLPGAAPVQIIRRFGLRFAPRGPVWATPDPAALRALRIHVINSDRDQPDVMRMAGYRQIMTSAYVAELDLTGSHDDRLNNAHGKWRNIWRRGRRGPFRIKREPFAPDLHHWLLQADLDQQRSKGYRALPQNVLHAFATLYPQDAILFTARIKRDPIAAMLLLCHAPVVTYHIGWTNADGRKLGAHHALLIQAADHFAAQGFTRLDLGNVDTENAAGLARFKIGSGADIRALGGTWLRMP
ncbi:GNAT family N-acetyltransferase [Loktanella agnita]|uniref:GNAT family N-acetyltransferase n=1 Tax=Loktanella agnita TaxID=287097 RepID=UPI003987E836